ncbi:MAG: hypothetical protein GF375_00110, partial [Candidatus Omnitrophica bacterium]|nr:hypothetical protein [Candidatus Omnitrophota bacterium]MBD3268572.1 hypothetical protein [Candidatus Omnitrophota bacterium]
MKKLLLFSSSSSLYGSERGLLNLIEALYNRHKLIAVVPAKGELIEKIKRYYPEVEIKKLPLPVLALSYSPFYYFNLAVLSLLVLIYFIPFILNRKIDIICTNNLLLPVSALTAKIAKKKHIWFVREFFPYSLFNRILAGIVLKFSDEIIFQSYFIKKKIGITNRGKVIYEPLIENRYKLYERAAARKYFQLPGDKIIISLISRIHPNKGQYEFIKKFTDYFYEDNDVILLLAGDISFSSLRNMLYKRKILNFIRSAGNGKIIFKGFVAEIDKMISAVDICVFP